MIPSPGKSSPPHLALSTPALGRVPYAPIVLTPFDLNVQSASSFPAPTLFFSFLVMLLEYDVGRE